jgi:hypothetical protein
MSERLDCLGCGNCVGAEAEVLQVAYAKVLDNHACFDGDSVFKTWLLAAVVTVCVALPCPASEKESARPSLKGVPAFRVVVDLVGSKADRGDTLNLQDLQADVERQLAQAGIRVSKDADATLYANVAVVCGRVEWCAFNVALEVQQRVRLERRPHAGTLIAPTWSTGITGLVARQTRLIRQNLHDQVDQFIAAYRAATQ